MQFKRAEKIAAGLQDNTRIGPYRPIRSTPLWAIVCRKALKGIQGVIRRIDCLTLQLWIFQIKSNYVALSIIYVQVKVYLYGSTLRFSHTRKWTIFGTNQRKQTGFCYPFAKRMIWTLSIRLQLKSELRNQMFSMMAIHSGRNRCFIIHNYEHMITTSLQCSNTMMFT